MVPASSVLCGELPWTIFRRRLVRGDCKPFDPPAAASGKQNCICAGTLSSAIHTRCNHKIYVNLQNSLLRFVKSGDWPCDFGPYHV